MKEHWLPKRLTEIKRQKSELARHLGVAPPRISEIISGVREVQADEIPKLASFLGMTIEEVVASLHGNLRGAPRVKTYLKGTAQAGHWMVSEHWPGGRMGTDRSSRPSCLSRDGALLGSRRRRLDGTRFIPMAP